MSKLKFNYFKFVGKDMIKRTENKVKKKAYELVGNLKNNA
jgi:hypothetical protein